MIHDAMSFMRELGPAMPDEELQRQLLALRSSAPKRSMKPQDSTDDCPLFSSANQKGLDL